MKDCAQLANFSGKKLSAEHSLKIDPIIFNLVLSLPMATERCHLVNFICKNVNMKFENITTRRTCVLQGHNVPIGIRTSEETWSRQVKFGGGRLKTDLPFDMLVLDIGWQFEAFDVADEKGFFQVFR